MPHSLADKQAAAPHFPPRQEPRIFVGAYEYCRALAPVKQGQNAVRATEPPQEEAHLTAAATLGSLTMVTTEMSA